MSLTFSSLISQFSFSCTPYFSQIGFLSISTAVLSPPSLSLFSCMTSPSLVTFLHSFPGHAQAWIISLIFHLHGLSATYFLCYLPLSILFYEVSVCMPDFRGALCSWGPGQQLLLPWMPWTLVPCKSRDSINSIWWNLYAYSILKNFSCKKEK